MKLDQKLFNEVVGCIRTACEGTVGEVRPESRLREDLNMESLQLVLLQVELESVFGFTFDPLDDDFRKIFQTAESVYRYVRDRADE